MDKNKFYNQKRQIMLKTLKNLGMYWNLSGSVYDIVQSSSCTPWLLDELCMIIETSCSNVNVQIDNQIWKIKKIKEKEKQNN